MMDCREVTKSYASDKPYSLAKRLLRLIHLLYCKGCRDFLTHLSILRRAARAKERTPSAQEINQVTEASIKAVQKISRDS